MSTKLTSSQKSVVQQFRNITSTSEKVATEYLKKSNWELDRAVDDYYNSTGGSLSSSASTSKEMEQAFDKYKQLSNNTNEETINNITLDGILALAKDLDTDPESDPLLFVLFYKLGCKTAYNITPDEWKQGMSELKITKFDQLKKKIQQVKQDIYNDANQFKEFYEYVFDYSLEEGAKTVPPDVAIGQWKLVLKGKYKFLDVWCEYIEKVFKKAITADTWKLFLDFTKNYPSGDYKDYDADAGAWPVAIDDFCVYHQEKLKK
ncbi:hypothetical protein C9374_003668 [Naegleria lovaniensis]|uniref:Defective in cullin neddylation protein n=1 Tax=Naegleria lovaniensis TaxID=51637 RepID=A0AA88H5L7_NAELO|nr:uncharacterized protein C9374_003668 [Naegleria lovaniensis]KAG2393904.1 hypothetical protein C9374_003668 [Naegleria lovaniensis]